jgi:hypothetical protein
MLHSHCPKRSSATAARARALGYRDKATLAFVMAAGSPRVTLLALPFGKQQARRQAHRDTLINLALQILREAAQRSAHESVGTLDVRLALHVLRPFVGEQRLLVEFWKAATIEPRHPWTSCHLPYRWIAQRLIDKGAAVDEANRP